MKFNQIYNTAHNTVFQYIDRKTVELKQALLYRSMWIYAIYITSLLKLQKVLFICCKTVISSVTYIEGKTEFWSSSKHSK